MTAPDRLTAALDRVRRRAFAVGATRVGLVGFSSTALAGTVLLVAVPWVPARALPWAAAGCLGVGAMAAGYLGTREWRRARPLLSRLEAASRVALDRPAVAELLHTGADLAAWGEAGAGERGASPELTALQVEAAADAAADADRRRALPWSAARPAAGRAAFAAGLLAAALAVNPEGAAKLWRASSLRAAARQVAVGNLGLLLEPPAYTGLPPSRVEGASGAVEGLRGTRVTLEGELSDPATAGRWRGSDGREVQLEVAGRKFRVSWLLDRSGTYGLAFERGGQALAADFREQPVTVRPDERPRVEMTVPEGDLEVRSDTEVLVSYSATDDFRVVRVELVLQGQRGGEVRIPVRLPAPGAAAASVEGTARFLPLSYPNLGAGAHLRVEAWDGDTVSGPKAGQSRSVYVALIDKKRLQADIEGLEERLLDAMLVHLADHLELAKGASGIDRLRGKAADLLRLLGSLSDRVKLGAEEGALAAAAVLRIEDGLRTVLAPFAAGGDDRAGIVPELERDILFLDGLLRNLRMEQTLDLGDELAAIQRGLFDDLRSGVDPKNLLGRLQQIEQLIGQMMDRLTRGASEMPDAFANADAVKDAPANELRDTLEKLKEALRAGDRERAKKLAEELLDTVSRWMKALEGAAEKAAGGQIDPVLRELAEMQDEVEKLMAAEEKLQGETRSEAEELTRKSQETVRDEFEALLRREAERLNRVAEFARRMEGSAPHRPFHGGMPGFAAPSTPEDRREGLDLYEASRRFGTALTELYKSLRDQPGSAKSNLGELADAFDALEREVLEQLPSADPREDATKAYGDAGRRELEALRRDLEALDGKRLQAASSKDRQELQALQGRQGRLDERTGSLSEKLEELSRKSPFAGQGLPKRARGARDAMRGAGERLGEGDPFGALPREGQALEELSGLAKELSQAQRQMRRGKGPGGFRVMGPGGTSGEGGRDVDRSRVEIPKEAEAKELKAFREEVLRAMRRGDYPKDYEDEVERYYEKLIR